MADLGVDVSLGVALSEIEKKVGQAEVYRDYLKTNLSNKGVDVSRLTKMGELIPKIKDIVVEKHSFPHWYNPSGNYVKCSHMSHPRRNLTSARVGTKIYAIGGEVEGSSEYVPYVECYDIERNTWVDKASMLFTGSDISGAEVEGKIYVYCWVQQRGSSPIAYYNPIIDTWGEKTKVPLTRMGATLSSVGQSLYVIGGRMGMNVFGRNECYNVVSSTWSEKRDLPGVICGANTVTLNDNIYIMGGLTRASGRDTNNRVFCYTPLTDTWSEKSVMPRPFRRLALAGFGDTIYVFGGMDGYSYNQKNCACLNTKSNEWKSITDYPYSMFGGGASSSNDKNIYIFGGYGKTLDRDNDHLLGVMNCYLI